MKLPENPVFVVGYPRSGTTLMQFALTATVVAPPMLSFPETHYFNVLEKTVVGIDGIVSAELLKTSRELIERKTGIHLNPSDFFDLLKWADSGEMHSRELFEWLVVKNIEEIHPGFIENKNFIWVEKTTYHANFLPRIFRLYPDARCIFMVRHPVPAVISRRKHFLFNPETPLEQLAAHWGNMLGKVNKAQRSYPDRILTVRYEDLVSNPHNYLEDISDYLNVKIDLGKLGRIPDKASSMILDHEIWKRANLIPGFSNSNPSYRHLVSEEDVIRIENVVSDGMQRMGYEGFWEGIAGDRENN